jgi:heme-degrading monooxygenase HmoA
VVILEAAVLQVREGAEAGFEEAMVKAAPAIAGSPGYIGHELQR